MDPIQAVQILAALGQPTRLAVFRLLIRTDTAIAAGEIAAALDIPRNTLSAHLAVLTRAELVQGSRSGTNIYYQPNLSRLLALTSFLVEGCCDGKSELCEPVLSQIRTLGLGDVE